jgi:hypothetical protein
MNNISGHSSPLAFIFKKNQGVVQMWTKKTTTDEKWVGRFPHDNEIGWEIFHHIPPADESPEVIRPTPIEPERYEHLRYTYAWLDTQSKNWWDNFMENQFFMLPQDFQFPANVWDVVPPLQRPNNVDIFAAGIQRQRSATINVENQVPQAAHEFTVGELIAVRPPPPEGDPVEDAPPPRPFWVAKITEILTDDGGSLKFNYYRVSEKNDRRFQPDPGMSHGSSKFTAVLAHDFELTTTNLIHRRTLRQIHTHL